MEKVTYNKDLKVFYKTASSFPEGILDAHKQLHALIPFSSERGYFGISRPENGNIVYRAATEETYPGEAEKFHCDTLVLKKGTYICLSLKDYMKDISSIRNAFAELLKQPGLDPEGYCVEWYVNDTDVKCMIRLEE